MRRVVPPPLPRNERSWHIAVTVMLVLSLAFPLVAATIAGVLAVDFLVLSRVRTLKVLFEQATARADCECREARMHRPT